MNDWIDRMFNKHKLVRRSLVFWAMGLITFVAVTIMLNMDEVTDPVASVARAVIGLLAVVIGFYQYSRGKN